MHHESRYNMEIVDTVVVPDVPPGDYVLGFRYDCVRSSQLLSSTLDCVLHAPVLCLVLYVDLDL